MNTNNRKPEKGKTRKLVPLNVAVTTPAEDSAVIVLDTRFVGQANARKVALEIVARATNPLRDMTRPIACVLLVGKSRTGKTRLAELVAEIVGAELLKINCGNYKEQHHASRFIGSPTGYYGWDDPNEAKKPGKSTAAKLNNANIIAHRGTKIPVTVALFDEVDELHRSLDNTLLSIMDKGQLDLGNNEVADFRNTILFMTTNLGMKQAEAKKAKRPIGFNRADTSEQPLTEAEIKESVDEALKDRYEPQWLNRLDETIIFGALTEDQIRGILDVEIDRFMKERIDMLPKGKYFAIEVQPSAREFILGKSLANKGDVSNLRRSIQTYLSDPLGKALNAGNIPACAVVVAQYVEGDALNFFIAEGEKVAGGTGDDAGSDARAQHRGAAAQAEEETEDRREGQAIQRRINRASQGAKDGAPVLAFDIILKAKSKALLTKHTAQLMHDLTEVYDMEPVSVSTQLRAPWAMVVIAEGTQAQMDQLVSVYGRDPEDSPDIAVRKHQGELAK